MLIVGPQELSSNNGLHHIYVFTDAFMCFSLLFMQKIRKKNEAILLKPCYRRTDGQSCTHRALQQSRKFNTKNSNSNKHLIKKLKP